MTFGWACMSAGRPSAIFWPKSSTRTWSQMPITTSMWCSIRIPVMPWSRILRMMATSSSMSGAVNPAAASSRRRQRRRAGNFQQPLLARRQVARLLVGQVAEADKPDLPQAALDGRLLFAQIARGVQRHIQDVAGKAVVQTHLHVLQCRHLAKQLHVLEGARDARARNGRRTAAQHT